MIIIIAGIFAGVWPCSTITILGKLFGAESKGQVYGHLHAYLYDNKSSLLTLSWQYLHDQSMNLYI